MIKSMTKIEICNLVDFLWVDEAFSDDQDSHEKFRRAYEKSEITTGNYRQSLFRNGSDDFKFIPGALKKLLYSKEQAGVLEVMLGLTSGPNTGLMFDNLKWIKPDYSTASDEIILNLSNNNEYTVIPNDYFFINPHLSNQERHQDYLDYLKNQASNFKRCISGMKSDDISKQTCPTSSEIHQVTKLDRSCTKVYIHSTNLVVPKSKENLPERERILLEARTINGHQLGILCTSSGVYSYEQPSSELVKKYIRFRKYWFAYAENLIRERKEYNHNFSSQYQLSDNFPDEDSLLQYLEWVTQMLSYYEDRNTHSLPAVLSYALITKLSAWYPDIPSAIDYFNSLVRQDNAEVRVDKGYTVYKRHQPFIEMLIGGIRELRGRSYDYYSKTDNRFFSEDQITENLKNRIDEPNGVVTELQVRDGKSFIDLLLRSVEPVAELAVEAKIAYKNGKLSSKQEIEKALFVQAPSYAERLNCDACIVFYILDGDLLTVKNSVREIVISRPDWSISPNLPEKAPKHYVLRKKSRLESEDLLIDVLFVCLPSQSNTQKSRSNK